MGHTGRAFGVGTRSSQRPFFFLGSVFESENLRRVGQIIGLRVWLTVEVKARLDCMIFDVMT